MKGLILSGGKGTRLRPFTYTRAKQLIPVANKPVLVRVVETMRDAGVTEIGVIVGQTGAEIRAELGSGEKYGVTLTYIDQPQALGLAHAVATARDFLGDDRFVMFLGDNVIQGGISTLIRDFNNHDWNSQIVLKRVPDPTSFGVAVLREDGAIKQLIEKPQVPPSDLALVGVYMFDHHIHEAVSSIQPSKRGEYEITDAIQWLIDHDYVVQPHVHDGWWIDTGKAPDMIEANTLVLDELKPSVAPDVVIENSLIDSRVTIESGTRIINSTIHGPSIIGANCVIENAYVGTFTSIYHHVTLRNCEIERSIILEHSQITDLDVRLHGCLIGRDVLVSRKTEKPRTLTMNLGDHSSVWVI